MAPPVDLLHPLGNDPVECSAPRIDDETAFLAKLRDAVLHEPVIHEGACRLRDRFDALDLDVAILSQCMIAGEPAFKGCNVALQLEGRHWQSDDQQVNGVELHIMQCAEYQGQVFGSFSIAVVLQHIGIEDVGGEVDTLCIPNPGPAMLLVGYRPAKSDIATRYLPSEVR